MMESTQWFGDDWTWTTVKRRSSCCLPLHLFPDCSYKVPGRPGHPSVRQGSDMPTHGIPPGPDTHPTLLAGNQCSRICRTRRNSTFPHVGFIHSHSIVPGGLLVMSYTTRLTLRTLLQMRVDTTLRNSGLKGYQSAVMPSVLVTALRATTCECVR